MPDQEKLSPYAKYSKLIQCVLDRPGMDINFYSGTTDIKYDTTRRMLADAVTYGFVKQTGSEFIPGPRFTNEWKVTLELEKQ